MFKIKHMICPNCSVGCGINLITSNNEVIDTFPYKNHPINEGKNCANGLNISKQLNEERYNTSLIKKDNSFEKSDYNSSLDILFQKLKSHKANEIGIICSEKLTNEDLKSIKKFVNTQGIKKIGFKTHFPKSNNIATYDEIETSNSILILGDIFKNHPLLARKIILAKNNGSKIFAADVKKTKTLINADKYIIKNTFDEILNDLPTEILSNLNKSSIIIYDQTITNNFDKINKISNKTSSKILPVLKYCNSKGTMEIFDPINPSEIKPFLDSIKILMIIGNETLENEEIADNIEFLTLICPFKDELHDKADLIIPSIAWSEKSGSFTNNIGFIQKFEKMVSCPYDIDSITGIIKKITN